MSYRGWPRNGSRLLWSAAKLRAIASQSQHTDAAAGPPADCSVYVQRAADTDAVLGDYWTELFA